MRSFFNILLYLSILFSFENSGYSKSNDQIEEICQKRPKRTTCIKNLKLKNYNLLKGNKIEIPVIPFKK